MIESITVADIATYGAEPQTLGKLSLFNFIFGANATGKTTISRVIAGESNFPTCKVAWKGGTKLQPLVYNQDFIDSNFNQSTELRGVFTLGQHQIETIKKIAAAKSEVDRLTSKIEQLTLGLQGADGQGGKRGELAAEESWVTEKCWAQKRKHDAKLQGAFEGFRNNTARFKGKVLQEKAENTASLVTLEDLEKRAESVFGPTPTSERIVPAVHTAQILAYEKAPILRKRVLGKDDVDIAAMINKLGSSDWVRQGRVYYEINDGICPFCQQQTSDSLAKSLAEYFDEAFEADTQTIEALCAEFSADSARLQQEIQAILGSPSRFLDLEPLKVERGVLDSILTLNEQRLTAKKKEPSQLVQLESLGSVTTAINVIIGTANTLVTQHNTMVANLADERATLTAQVWRYLLDQELKADLDSYTARRAALEKAVSAMSEQISTSVAEKERLLAEIRQLEKTTTSVQPTIDDINALLTSFGFRNFSLARAANETSYKLVRADGSDAKTTLSEGEKSFVTMLYFYHLLKGSESESGMTIDRVVVFDDPVSSFDSDVLFIVASLIKGLFDEVRSGTGHAKQVFVLTHNVYFHKEVTFNPRRRDTAMSEETFWVVRKPSMTSVLEQHNCNPIKTSYELLWSEVRNPNRSKLTIQNTLRRILENYFKILGGIDLTSLCAQLSGKEMTMCRSLCSWVHDGSHYAHDDFYLSVDDAMVEAYLGVFKSIFEKSGHIAHYRMMMGDADEAKG